MADGSPTPRNLDGMTCFGRGDGLLRLVRNHEVRNAAGDFALGVTGPAAARYDPRAAGGCVTLDFDSATMKPVREFVSLNGTLVNCSGGLAFGDAGWLTCEETIAGPAHGFERPHGYTFFVGREWDEARPARPIAAMGRFVKEAAVADRHGVVYQTEDAGQNSGFYRFLPRIPEDLHAGGALQMLAIRGRRNHDTRLGQALGAELPVEWVPIADPDPAAGDAQASCFAQGFAAGGARFSRLEGLFRGEGDCVYFISTTGGDAARGQLWQYVPADERTGTLVLRYQSPSARVLDSPDNLCVTPGGAILFCEDDATRDDDAHALAPGIANVNRLVALAHGVEPFALAVNVLNAGEFAGACFSPDGAILFVNLFGTGVAGSGMTCAITGPWERGPL